MSYRIRRFADGDRAAMTAFAQGLPEHDLLFLGRDLRHPRVIEAWLEAIAEGWIDSYLAEQDGAVIASAALVRDPLGWSAHVGEVRLLVSSARRNAGLGRDLLECLFAAARTHRLAKLTAALTPDQTGAVALFESVGFRTEALLHDQVRDRAGVPHDLAILAYDFARVANRQHVLGLE